MENYGNIKAINYKIDGLKDGLRIVNLIKSIFSKKKLGYTLQHTC